MAEGVLARAQKRLASSRLGWMRLASDATLPGSRHKRALLQSDRRFYFIKCPACGHEQRLIWEENVDLKKAAVVCSKARCRGPLGPALAGTLDRRGARQRPRPRLSPKPPLLTFGKPAPDGLRERGDVAKRDQEFQNSVLGETFVTARRLPEPRPPRPLPPRLRAAGGLKGDDLHGRRRRHKAPCRDPPPPRRDG